MDDPETKACGRNPCNRRKCCVDVNPEDPPDIPTCENSFDAGRCAVDGEILMDDPETKLCGRNACNRKKCCVDRCDNVDCDDNDPATVDTCSLGVCSNVDSCDNVDCDDNDPETVDTCSQGVCSNVNPCPTFVGGLGSLGECTSADDIVPVYADLIGTAINLSNGASSEYFTEIASNQYIVSVRDDDPNFCKMILIEITKIGNDCELSILEAGAIEYTTSPRESSAQCHASASTNWANRFVGIVAPTNSDNGYGIGEFGYKTCGVDPCDVNCDDGTDETVDSCFLGVCSNVDLCAGVDCDDGIDETVDSCFLGECSNVCVECQESGSIETICACA